MSVISLSSHVAARIGLLSAILAGGTLVACAPPPEPPREGDGEGEGEGEGEALLPDGASCEEGGQCASAFCTTGCASGADCDTTARACAAAAPGAFGDACDELGASTQCASGVCSGGTQACADCSEAIPCPDASAVCARFRDESERCLPPLLAGEECFFVNDRGETLSHACAAGLECGHVAAPSSTEVSATCVAPAAEGGTCDDFSGWQYPPEDGCAAGLYCSASTSTCAVE